jgi:mono/diheme cytochrome c family protein
MSGLTPQFTCCLTVLAATAILAGCQQKMAGQPSYAPLEPCDFFADGRSARPLVAGTVARGQLRTDTAFFTGRKVVRASVAGSNFENSSVSPGSAKSPFDDNSDFVTELPLPIDRSLVEHGRNRYSIYCVVCHDPLGTGRGKIVERGYTRPPSYHIDRLREAPAGRLFAVISEGYGSMPSYSAQIPPEDRWAIVAYVRALQISQHFPERDLAPEDKQKLSAMPRQPMQARLNSRSETSLP